MCKIEDIIKNVPVEMAPQASQDTFKRFGRSEYAAMIADNPVEPPLDAKPLVAMFHIRRSRHLTMRGGAA
jgi:ABC-type uncharacterized transport system YnjBCD substrate-binding protein